MGLREYVIRRGIYMFLLVVAVVCFNFFLFRLPTLVLGISPVDLMISEELRRNLTQDALQQIYVQFGLVPDPDIFDWIYMFWRYLVNMFTGNFGRSFVSKTPVMAEIASRLPNTLLLMGTSSIVSIIIGIWTGVKVAADPGSRKDVGAVTVALFIYALPIFWFGMLLLMVFAFYMRTATGGLFYFPLGGTIDYALWGIAKESPYGALMLAGNILHHLFLPMITLGVGGYGGYFLYMRNNLNPDYIANSEENRRHDRRLHTDRTSKGIGREPGTVQARSEKCATTNGNNNSHEFWLPNQWSDAYRNGVQLVRDGSVYIHQPVPVRLSCGPSDIYGNRDNSDTCEFRGRPSVWSP